MDMNGYQSGAMRTAADLDGSDKTLAILALGVAGEAGEVADYIKKVVGHGHKMDKDKLVKELGDVLWYVAVLSHVVGVELDTVAATNIAKLKARYPDGFSSERSVNRSDEPRGHIQHKCGSDDCFVCSGGLYQCEICGQVESEVQEWCPGYKQR